MSEISKRALEYLQKKKLHPAFSYKDVWNEEHATAFTVAKMMQVDLLDDVKKALEKAIADGQTYEWFKKQIHPIMQQKGWWGRKEMTDPLTGEKVLAQLGSNRRTELIYQMNVRGAYMQAAYERGMESDAHPYWRWEVGPVGKSGKHRETHLSWNNLILPKSDPFWEGKLPLPVEYMCKCSVTAVSEITKQRYEKKGVPYYDQNLKKTVWQPINTQRPKEEYNTFFNERRGILERIPKGVAPGFYKKMPGTRNMNLLKTYLTKVCDKLPTQYDELAKSIMSNSVEKEAFYSFIERALAQKIDAKYATAAGFLDNKTLKFLKSKGLELSDTPVIALECRLVDGKKYSGGKHERMGNAPTKEDWYNIMDFLMDAEIFWDGHGLVYLRKLSQTRFMKIFVDVGSRLRHKSASFSMPKIDTMYILDESTERGFDELKRIKQFEKVR